MSNVKLAPLRAVIATVAIAAVTAVVAGALFLSDGGRDQTPKMVLNEVTLPHVLGELENCGVYMQTRQTDGSVGWKRLGIAQCRPFSPSALPLTELPNFVSEVGTQANQ